MNNREIELLPKIELAITELNWDELSNLLSPKLFATIKSGDLIAPQVLAKVAQILTTADSIPDKVKISCLKCLGNSCFNAYKHKECSFEKSQNDVYCHDLYLTLAQRDVNSQPQTREYYPYSSHFPYEGVAAWSSNCILSNYRNNDPSEDSVEMLRLSIQFLCNLFTFACKDAKFPEELNFPECLRTVNIKSAIIDCTNFEHTSIVKASCIFVHNALKELPDDYFSEPEKARLCCQLLKPIKQGFASARESILFLLSRENILRNSYETMPVNEKLYLLELIYNEVSDSVYNAEEESSHDAFAEDTIAFLAERFRRRSDLILKTVDTYLDGMEPTEIMILLDILGVLMTGDSKKYAFLRNDKSLLINCACEYIASMNDSGLKVRQINRGISVDLLKAIQMIGKESDNYFTPIQKLSAVAPSTQTVNIDQELKNDTNGAVRNDGKSDFHSHPAFGFKAGLIRVIGNMSYRNKMIQDLLRETDAIPLLLDCCNIDARNPLIMQWTILALRNVCEGNLENQKIIRNCTKVSLVENALLTEMGLTLHEEEDGKKIGIVPLVRDRRD